MEQTHTRIGDLDAVVIDAGESTQPSLVVVLCHGYGAPGNDLVPLAEALVAENSDLQTNVRFVFPAAPDPLPGLEMFGSRMWWPLNVEDIYRTIREEGFDAVCNAVPDGLSRARRKMRVLLDTLQRDL